MMTKAVFLDRDGVINMERGTYTWRLDDFKFVPDILNNLKKLYDHGFMLIVITNQGGIAKGMFQQEEVEAIHRFMLQEMANRGIYIEEVYYCPHHPHYGKCLCRKPAPLMIEKALSRFNISHNKAFFIGDHERDYEAGIKSGIKTYKIEANSSIANICNEIIKSCPDD